MTAFDIQPGNYHVPARAELPILGITIPADGCPYDIHAKRDAIARGSLYAGGEIWKNKFISLKDKLNYYFMQKLPVYFWGAEI